MKALRKVRCRALIGFCFAVLVGCTTVPKGRGQLVDAIVTPHYYISIRSLNGLQSHDLKFFVEDRKTRTSRVVDGRKVVAPCPSGEPSPCENLIGYKFNEGDDHFFITPSGRLTVERNDQTVLWERGDWEEEGGAGQ